MTERDRWAPSEVPDTSETTSQDSVQMFPCKCWTKADVHTLTLKVSFVRGQTRRLRHTHTPTHAQIKSRENGELLVVIQVPVLGF